MIRRLIDIARGQSGHPTHPPLTDVTIGAFTTGVVLAIAGWLGLEEEKLAVGAFLAIVAGLAFSLPTVVTGLLDYLAISRGTPPWRTITFHWLVMATAVAVFVVAAALLQEGYDDGAVPTAGLLVALAAEGILIVGGWLGGSVVFVHGIRVLNQPEARTRDATLPKRMEK